MAVHQQKKTLEHSFGVLWATLLQVVNVYVE